MTTVQSHLKTVYNTPVMQVLYVIHNMYYILCMASKVISHFTKQKIQEITLKPRTLDLEEMQKSL